jgi:glutamyl-tRNA reductase
VTDVQPAISSLTSWADGIRAGELARVESKLAGLSQEDRRLVERLTARIVREFLRVPVEQMRSGVDYTGVVEYLFGVGEAVP